ncbi:MAG: NUDIX hydrolase [Candidatus Cyclobacteriaceae bacterium M3_2C_046]
MKLFINDKPVNILPIKDLPDLEKFDVMIDGEVEKIYANQLIDDVLIINASLEQVDQIFRFLTEKPFKKLDSITMGVNDPKSAKHFVKRKFSIIKAGGGLVVKDDKFLLIHRLGKWDLPKGKLEKGEKVKKGAIREVEEECNIKVRLGQKICHTWHTYTRNNKRILKKTSWYLMHIVDESNMAPQKEEDITDVRWMLPRDTKIALYNSYPNIRHVFKEYFKLQEANELRP